MYSITLFRNKSCALNKMHYRNNSKLAVSYAKNNHVIFCTLLFPYVNVLVYVDMDQGIHKGKIKLDEMKTNKKIHRFSQTNYI